MKITLLFTFERQRHDEVWYYEQLPRADQSRGIERAVGRLQIKKAALPEPYPGELKVTIESEGN